MAQPTTSLTRFVGPLYVGASAPTAADVGKPLEAGMIYLDIESETRLCVYDGSAWDCTGALTAAESAATSTSTTTSTTTSTSTSTSTTTTAT